MYPAFQPNAEFAVGLNSDSPFLDNPAAEVATTVEEQPATPIVPLGVRHNRHFIEANTKPVDIAHLRTDCVVPVFSKDNEVTISHQSFIETVLGAAHRMFPQEVIDTPDIVVFPYHQGTDSRSHPQTREPALGNRQDHLLRTDGFLFRDTYDLRGCGREQTESLDRRCTSLQPRESLFQEDGGEIQGLHRLQEPRVL